MVTVGGGRKSAKSMTFMSAERGSTFTFPPASPVSLLLIPLIPPALQLAAGTPEYDNADGCDGAGGSLSALEIGVGGRKFEDGVRESTKGFDSTSLDATAALDICGRDRCWPRGDGRGRKGGIG